MSKRAVNFRSNLLIILAISIASYVATPSKLTRITEWITSPDNAIKLRTLIAKDATAKIPTTIIDIDDDTFLAWQRPRDTPLPKLFELIKAAAVRKPMAIIVDVDVASSSNATALSDFSGDLRALASHPSSPPIIFMRRLWRHRSVVGSLSSETISFPAYGDTDSEGLRSAVKEFEVFVGQAEKLIWASSNFILDNDGVLREWRLGASVCNPERGLPTLLLAPNLIVAAISNAGHQTEISKLKEALARIAEQNCYSKDIDLAGLIKKNILSSKRVDGLSTPIPYQFAYDRKSGSLAGQHIISDPHGKAVPSLIVVPAKELLATAGNAKLDEHFPIDCGNTTSSDQRASLVRSCLEFEGRTVIVGASHFDSSDLVQTPIGKMPGLDVIANLISNATAYYSSSEGNVLSPFQISMILFLFMLVGTLLIPPFATAVFVPAVVLIFILVSGPLGINSAECYTAISSSILMTGSALALGSAWKWLQRMRRS